MSWHVFPEDHFSEMRWLPCRFMRTACQWENKVLLRELELLREHAAAQLSYAWRKARL